MEKDTDRIVIVRSAPGSTPGAGSGFWVGGRYVLTVNFIVEGEECIVQTTAGDVPAQVVAHSSDGNVPLAVLELSLDDELPWVDFGQVDLTTVSVIECFAEGFVRWVEPHEEGLRRTRIEGRINIGEDPNSHALTMHIHSRSMPVTDPGQISPWSGIAGAAVFTNENVLIGVIYGRPTTDFSSLSLTPITALQYLAPDEWMQFSATLGAQNVPHLSLLVPGGQGEEARRVEPEFEDAEISPTVVSTPYYEAAGSSASPPYRNGVDFVADAPSAVDLLNRQALAMFLAHKLMSINRRDKQQTSFLIQVDGPWGSGKSTLLSLMQQELDSSWLTVPFNAWREEGLGPPWWSLLTSVRHAHVRRISWWRRAEVRFAEFLYRLRAAGAPYGVAMALLIGLSLLIFNIFRSSGLDAKGITEIAKAIAAVVAAGATLWAGSMVAGRFLLWDSARGARLFEQSTESPARTISAHFAWLIRRVHAPVVFFIDDLDRCKPAYVVELLEAVQTLLRDPGAMIPAPRRRKQPAATPAVYFIVAADGAWVRNSYEKAFADLHAAVSEPGRPLGYLFLDKLFQLRVTMPNMDSSHGREYLKRLLRTPLDHDPEREKISQQVQSVRHELENSASTAEYNDILQKTTPEVVLELSSLVVENYATPEHEQEIEHSLERFGELLHFNPRSTKRFLNSYSIMQVVLILEGKAVDPDTLALWLILETRWPSLADALRKNPDLLTTKHLTTGNTYVASITGADRKLLALLSSAEVHKVIDFPHGGPLTPATIRSLYSGTNYEPEPMPVLGESIVSFTP